MWRVGCVAGRQYFCRFQVGLRAGEIFFSGSSQIAGWLQMEFSGSSRECRHQRYRTLHKNEFLIGVPLKTVSAPCGQTGQSNNKQIERERRGGGGGYMCECLAWVSDTSVRRRRVKVAWQCRESNLPFLPTSASNASSCYLQKHNGQREIASAENKRKNCRIFIHWRPFFNLFFFLFHETVPLRKNAQGFLSLRIER